LVTVSWRIFHLTFSFRVAQLIADSRKLNKARVNPVKYFRLKEEKQLEQSARLLKRKRSDSPELSECVIGDRMPDTDKALINLFGLHPLPKQRKRIDGTFFLDSSIPPTCDEGLLPSMKLTDHVRTFSADKVFTENFDDGSGESKALLTLKAGEGSEDVAKHADESLSSLFGNLFDASALVAITVFIEESIKEMMSIWQRTDCPLLFSKQSLSAEICAQINGSIEMGKVDDSELRYRLELLFGRNLEDFQELIKEKKENFIIQCQTSCNDPSSVLSSATSSSSVNLKSAYENVPSSYRYVSLRENEVFEKYPKLSVVADAKRQIIGGKRTEVDLKNHCPPYLFQPRTIPTPKDATNYPVEGQPIKPQKLNEKVFHRRRDDDDLLPW
jgi:hypothetical protein